MNSPPSTPWIERFRPLLNPTVIAERASLMPNPLIGVREMSPEQAKLAIEAEFKRIYYPSSQCVDVLLTWITHAHAHCQAMYPTSLRHIEGVYSPDSPLPEYSTPQCLHGMAGVGKSATLSAFTRLMPKVTTVTSSDGTVFPLESHRVVTLGNCSSTRDLLLQLTRHQGPGSSKRLEQLLRKQAFRDGVSFLCLDEFQFVSQSPTANSRVTQMLLSIYFIGLPWAFIANDSLVRKLKNRNNEDKHRLLKNHVELKPELPDSKDWVTQIEWWKRVAPDIFVFDAASDAEAIHQLTGGVNRAATHLLSVAATTAIRSQSNVDLSALKAAYNSRDYATFREEVEDSMSLDTRTRNRLTSPLQQATVVDAQEHFERKRQQATDENALLASLTPSERTAYKKIQAKNGPKQQAPAKVKTLKRSKEPAGTDRARSLLDNLDWLNDNL
ncbi:hypothetical protein [Pandoraea pnomenusa]|uniref:hypothetical protein n=1 Tax=Pandoraea pnomenusa TaxID=93220 RepID=UPI0033416CF1